MRGDLRGLPASYGQGSSIQPARGGEFRRRDGDLGAPWRLTYMIMKCSFSGRNHLVSLCNMPSMYHVCICTYICLPCFFLYINL